MSKFFYELDGYAGVVVDPSPQRVHNILTLEERVRAIQAYDERPMYTEVAIMFNCSWEQIKNIIANRDTILESYKATRNVNKTRGEIRKSKLTYLEECMYEYVQRAQFLRQHRHLNNHLLRTKALEFCDLIEIDTFVPNKSWINYFKTNYNISLSNRQITLTRIPPDSLDLKDIMTYCGKKKSHNDELVIVPTATQKTGQASQGPTPSDSERPISRTKTLEMVEHRRKRNINLMERALFEYLQRATFHRKIPPSCDRIRDVAIQLLNILRIEGLFPDRNWLKHFENRFNISLSQGVLVKDRTPPVSLDPRFLLSYCRRNNPAQPRATVRLTPKEHWAIIAVREKMRLEASKAAKSKRSMNKSAVVKRNCKSVDDDVIDVKSKQELIIIKDDDENGIENNIVFVKNEDSLKIENIETLTSPLSNDKSPQSPGHWSEHRGDNNPKAHVNNKGHDAADCDPPPLKILKIEKLASSLSNDEPLQSPGHSPEHSGDNAPDPDECDPPHLKILKIETLNSLLSSDKPTQSHWSEHRGDNNPKAHVNNEGHDAADCDPPPLKIIKIEKLASSLSNDEPLQSPGHSPEHSGDNAPDPDECDPPPLKILKIKTLNSLLSSDKPTQSPGHWSDHNGDNDPNAQEALPNVIRNYKDALRLLKSLEEFAMLEENYRVIGLISQLEDIFNNPPTTNPSDNGHEDNDANL